MYRRLYLIVVLTLCVGRHVPSLDADDNSLRLGDWPQFRGPQASGVSHAVPPPTTWNGETLDNIAWKTPIPGLGHASPIVVGDQVFIVTAVSDNPQPALRAGLYGDIWSVPQETEHSWQLICLNKWTGQVDWKRTLHSGVPIIKRHTKASHANSTPATNGRYVVVMLGSEGLYCLDRQGNQHWKQDLGVLDSGYYLFPIAQWGFASSPVIFQDLVIVQCDIQENSFLAAFDLRTGNLRWRTDRNEVPTWSTPTVYVGPAGNELIINGYRHTGGYDPHSGSELWKLAGGGDIPVPTPIIANDLIILASAHGPLAPLTVVRAGARGDITLPPNATSSDWVMWQHKRDGTYMQTPLVWGDYVYACKDNGILSCYELQTGKLLYRERLGTGAAGFTASPVAVDGKLYFTNELGETLVIAAGPTYQLLATNSLAEVCLATPAITNGMMIVRTTNYVWGIGQPVRGPDEKQVSGVTRAAWRGVTSGSAGRTGYLFRYRIRCRGER